MGGAVNESSDDPAAVPATAAARLRDILQIRFTPLFQGLPASALERISPHNPLKRLLKLVGYAGVRLLGNAVRSITNPNRLAGATWLYVVSPNNVDALRFVREGLPDAVFVAGQGKRLAQYANTVNRLSLRRKLTHYGQLQAVWRALRASEGPAAWRFFDLIFAAVGYYEEYRCELRRYRPRAVVFANDHNDDARALLLACRAEQIPTAYIQHASVSRWFPPLGFDLSLLEGRHALDTYRSCGPVAGHVSLVGMPKADAFIRRRNTEPRVRRVAIAASLLDPTDALLAALDVLLPALPELHFTFRPHPSDPRDFRALFGKRHPGLAYSDARSENVFAFLHRHDALIAADTSTHLEATLLNLVSLYFRFGHSRGLTDDYYGYVRHGLIDAVDSASELVERVAQLAVYKPDDVFRRATYYCATIATPHEGASEKLALDELVRWLG